MAGEYLLLGDFENTGYENLISQEESGGGVSIQYFRNEGLLDICLWKFFSEARNAYPLFE